jgi:ABC-type nitrate/sulfonate/bicarbonate transport system ATPase subunit
MTFFPDAASKIEVEHLYKSFEGLDVLEDVGLSVREKEFVALLGPSGCGKSTIFNIISGLLPADSGEIKINGERSDGKPGKVSYMQQKDLLLPWYRIIDNVSLPLLLSGKNKKEARKEVAPYFDIFGLEGFEYSYPREMSGGMRQRAAFMRTYLFSHNIMLLDEPFGGLDTITRTRLHGWLLDVLKRLETTVLFITHDVEEAVLLSDRIYLLSPRPAKITREVKVTLPGPRSVSTIHSPDFARIKQDLMASLEENMVRV